MRTAAAGLGAISVLTGCSNGDAPLPVATDGADCTAERIAEWTPVPSNANLGFIAERLQVDPSNVAGGVMAIASCEPSILASEVVKGVVVTIDEIPPEYRVASRCLALFSNAQSSPGAVTNQVGAACPAA